MLTVCEVCSSKFRIYGHVKGFTIFKCTKCGFGHTNVTENDIDQFYGASYFSGEKASFVQQKNDELSAGGRWWIDNNLENSRLDLLEIGPGISGAVYQYLKKDKKNINYEAVEISKEASLEIARKGAKIYVGKIYEDHIKQKLEGRFDYIIAQEVIEHDLNPRKFISGIYDALRNDGLVYLTTGNFDGIYARLAGLNWYYIDPPAHVVFFTPRSIKILFYEAGFKKVDIYFSGGNRVRRFINKFWFPGLEALISYLPIPTGMSIVATK